MAWFSYLIATDSLTFQIAAMKHGNGWVKSEKVQACYVGAILYAVTFVVAVCTHAHPCSLYLLRSIARNKISHRNIHHTSTVPVPVSDLQKACEPLQHPVRS